MPPLTPLTAVGALRRLPDETAAPTSVRAMSTVRSEIFSMKRQVLPLLALGALAFAACHRERTAPIAHQLVGDDNQALRQAFNADADKVRVLMLLSPS
jgi:hypothetical protein